MSDLISVIVPFFNEENHIRRCARSLFEQTYPNVEFIFVDDNSTDSSLASLKQTINEYSHLRHKIKIIENAVNKGSASSRNIGLSEATGIYIGWADADDWVDPNMFESLYGQAKKDDAEITWCNYVNIYENHEVVINQQNNTDSYSCINALISGYMIGALWNKLVVKSLFTDNHIRFPDGLDMCEDLRVTFQLFYHSKKNSFLNGEYYHYVKFRDNTTSTLSAYKPKVNQDWIENIKGIEKFIKEKEISGLDEKIILLKLLPKKNLLVRGTSIEHYKKWRLIFPESNSSIWRSSLPVYYKLVAWSADKQVWPIVRFWIFIKKTLKVVKNVRYSRMKRYSEI